MNREDVVLRQIAELEELEQQLNARAELDVNTKNQPSCPVCFGDWHGLDNHYCPGAFATAEQRQAFQEGHQALRATHIWLGRSWKELHRMGQQVTAVASAFATEVERIFPPGGTSVSWTHSIGEGNGAVIVSVHSPNGELLWAGYKDCADPPSPVLDIDFTELSIGNSPPP